MAKGRWKPEYQANRQRRIDSDPEYAAKYAEQQQRGKRKPEENRAYMREYYANNKEKYKRTREQQDRINAARRERYANDAEFREQCKAASKSRPIRAKRETRLREQYGIGNVEFDAMLEKQGGGCAICGKIHKEKSGGRLHVDHCHSSGAVRGLLCGNCNNGLGRFADDEARLERAAEYLRASRNGNMGHLVQS